ncbi:MAG: dodecin domain-containing protein [Gammaproteobacteria bacterium]|nr:dodecin domain-containing protein [Gammaproteobacteria bacterium]
MAKPKAAAAAIHRVTDVIGTSTLSWEGAAKSLRDLRVAEIEKLDLKIENGKVVAYRARVSLSFKYEA